jgi:hypothetical protein
MVNTLLALCKTDPQIRVNLEYQHPLAKEYPEIAGAFSSEEPNWDLLREEYGPGKVYINYGKPTEWREVSVALHRGDLERSLEKIRGWSPIEIRGRAIDSFTTQAMRRGKFSDSQWGETGIFGFSVSSDGYLIFGTRGGSESVGQIIPVPAGSVGYPQISPPGKYMEGVYDPISLANELEAHEEAGIRSEDIAKSSLVGVFCQDGEDGRGATPNNFFYLNRLTIPAEEVLGRHKRAMKIYNTIKAGDETQEEAARKGLELVATYDQTLPRDAWENKLLDHIPKDPVKLRERVSALGNELKHGMSGCLALYYLSEFGESEFGKLMDIPKVREMVDDSKLITI